MGPDRRTELRTAIRAQRAIALLRAGRAARAAAGPLSGWHDVRRPPRHLDRGTVLSPDPTTTGVVHRQTQGAVITALAWSPTAPELAVGGSSGLVQLWHIGRRAPARALAIRPAAGPSGKPEAIQALAFSPDGQLIAASDNSERSPALTRGAVARAPERSSCVAGDLAHEQRQTDARRHSTSERARALWSARILARRPARGREPRRTAATLSSTPGTAQTRQTLRPLGARLHRIARVRARRDTRDRHR